MNTKHICIFVTVALLFGFTTLQAQGWSKEQKEVWTVIGEQWKASVEKDTAWPDKYLHDKFQGWNNENPMPGRKSSIKKWNRYENENTTVLMHELFPVGIVLHEKTAVAHYFYSRAVENKKGERKTVHGRYTDILVKDNGTWRFLAWRGGDNPEDD